MNRTSIHLLLFTVCLVSGVVLTMISLSPINRELRALRVEMNALRAGVSENPPLREEIAALRETINALTSVAVSTNANGVALEQVISTMQPASPNKAASDAIDELKNAIDRIHNGMVKRGMLPPGSNEIASATEIVMSAQANVAEKLAALRTLRSVDARSDDVVRQMIQAYYSTEEPRYRADIFRQLEGVTTAELKMPLLEAVSTAVDHQVREEAAETLFSYLPDPDVKRWLEHLAANDPDEKVRAQALDSLRHWRAKERN